MGFTDACRFLYPQTSHFNYHCNRDNQPISTRIDQIWISDPAANNVCEYFTQSSYLITNSDHDIISTIIEYQISLITDHSPNHTAFQELQKNSSSRQN